MGGKKALNPSSCDSKNEPVLAAPAYLRSEARIRVRKPLNKVIPKDTGIPGTRLKIQARFVLHSRWEDRVEDGDDAADAGRRDEADMHQTLLKSGHKPKSLLPEADKAEKSSLNPQP